MHIHGNPMANGNLAVHSAVGRRRRPRASETRRWLLKGAFEIEGELDPAELLMVGRWAEGEPEPGQGQTDPQNRNFRRIPRETPQDQDDDYPAGPVSLWA